MTKKYELTNETIEQDGHILHRIRALKNFWNVKAGELGGLIESEKNLSQEGHCWVYENSQVYGNAKVYDNAKIYGTALVFGDA